VRTPVEIHEWQRGRIKTLEAQLAARDWHRGELERLVAALCILGSRTIDQEPHQVLAAAVEYLGAERERLEGMAERIRAELEMATS
jgi:hypothetical protein